MEENLRFVDQQKSNKASVAQWIEHPPPKGRVVGSIPTGGANLKSSFLISIQ